MPRRVQKLLACRRLSGFSFNRAVRGDLKTHFNRATPPRNRSRVIAVFEPKTNVCRKMVEHWLILPPFLKQNRGFLTP